MDGGGLCTVRVGAERHVVHQPTATVIKALFCVNRAHFTESTPKNSPFSSCRQTRVNLTRAPFVLSTPQSGQRRKPDRQFSYYHRHARTATPPVKKRTHVEAFQKQHHFCRVRRTELLLELLHSPAPW